MINQVLTPLPELCEFVSGGTPSRKIPAFFTGTIPWITSADLNGDVISRARDYITKEAIEQSATKIIPKDNILLVTRTGVGKVAITGVDICISQDFTGLVLKKERIDLRYLYFFLLASQDYLVSFQRGATIQGITREVLEGLRVPLPSLPEQQRIAAILQKADRIRRLRRQARQLSDSFLQSVFLEMFGDPSLNSKNWKKRIISSLLTNEKDGIQTGPFGSSLKKEEYVKSGIPVWGIESIVDKETNEEFSLFITPEKFAFLSRYSIQDGDILISRAGTVGKMRVVYPKIKPSIIGTNLIRIRLNPKICLPEYFSLLFTFFGNKIVHLKLDFRKPKKSAKSARTLKTEAVNQKPGSGVFTSLF